MDAIDDGPTLRTAGLTDEEHRRHRRGLVLAAGVGAVALMAVVALVALVVLTGRPAPQDPIGDPGTAEPCALLTRSWFDSDATLFRNHRVPQQCAAVVGPVAPSGTVEDSVRTVTAELTRIDSRTTPPLRTDGDLVVLRGTRPQLCTRLVVLPDGRAVKLAATGPNPCALTEAAADGAIDALQAGPLPRREPEPADALTRRDLCGAFDERTLAAVPGLDVRTVERGWAGWACRWGTSSGRQVQAAVYRTGPLGPATEPDGRTVVVRSDDETSGGCTAAVPHRAYRTPSGGMKVESLQVTVAGDPTGDCDEARRLAGTARASGLVR